MGNATTQQKHFPIAVILTVQDVAKSIAFYRDRLGFELERAWPDDKQPMWANLVLGGQSVMLGAKLPPEQIEQWASSDQEACAVKVRQAQEVAKHKPGVGISTYVMVPDVDAYHAAIVEKGVRVALAPRTQFYGIRETVVDDPDGFNFIFYSPVVLQSCQSCSMPLTDAKPGDMYCGYCVDEKGRLKPYEVILEGCISGYFIPMQKMTRPQAEQAAREMLAKQPAWSGRC